MPKIIVIELFIRENVLICHNYKPTQGCIVENKQIKSI